MASRQQGENWTEETVCPICLDFFTDPVILDCGHNFCRFCITQSWERQKINSCPQCREEFPDRNLRGNRALANLAKKARKLNLNPQEKESNHHCEEHQEELKLFCETDKKLICYTCVVSREHKSHNFISIKEAVEIYKGEVKSSLKSITEKKWEVSEMERRQKERISQVREQASSLKTHITSEFAELYQILSEKKQRLLRDLKEEEKRILKLMEKNLRKIQENLNSIEEKRSTLETQLREKDGVMFLKDDNCAKSRIYKENDTLELVDGALNDGHFRGPSSYTIWREFLEAIKPVSVTLDEETAHPELELSNDLKSVRWTGTARSLADNIKRFTIRESVLGSIGFTSGRHFWEVDVSGNRHWRLGVAAQSVDRKRSVGLKPENGFWTIQRSEDQFHIRPSLGSPLPVGYIPRNVGVYLNYEAGTVSFYCVDTKFQLHTFSGNKFTEKLYPFFWTWDKNKWLRICCNYNPNL
ncbi:zinc-binding protein A33-like isoform X1 [Chiloscyllium plagiosum]|uniref:zinc-binding protein A33-like isoform X1 n=1 Tax=Chiloscyllium plagiosum TaxID=36176 RepID=UPI001CB82485|nr:zinc-binding protein A33-like isoform X1 [Chiloscyllium plagiosum]